MSHTTIYNKDAIGGVAADRSLQSMCEYQGKLYVGTYNLTAATDATAAKLLVYDKNTNIWSTITKATMGAVNADEALTTMCVYDNKLYIGTYNTTAAIDATAAKLLVYDGTTWSVITKATMGGVNADNFRRFGITMGVFDNKLYFGMQNTTASTSATGAKIFIFNGTTWTTIIKSDIGCVNADTLFSGFHAYQDKLYIGTHNTTNTTGSTGTKMLVFDGTAWATYTKASLHLDSTITAISCFCTFYKYLVIGLYHPVDTASGDLTKWCFMTVADPNHVTFHPTKAVYTAGFSSGVMFNNWARDNGLLVGTLINYKDRLYTFYENDVPEIIHPDPPIQVYDGALWDFIPMSRFSKTANDLCMHCAVVYDDKIFFGTSNTQAQVDWRGAKIVAIG